MQSEYKIFQNSANRISNLEAQCAIQILYIQKKSVESTKKTSLNSGIGHILFPEPQIKKTKEHFFLKLLNFQGRKIHDFLI